jgi:N-acetylneuraminate lyase
MDKIIGFIAAPFTPMTDSCQINYDVIDHYADFLKSQKIAGVFVNGSTGEGLSLTVEERIQTAQRWIEHNDKDFKVIIHVGSASVVESEILASHAEDISAWGIGMQAPCFFKPQNVSDLVDVCKSVWTNAKSLPFYYYHIPVLTGSNFLMKDFLHQADKQFPELAGIKFTCENLMDYQMCKIQFEDKYDMLFGKDEFLLSALCIGAKGAVGSTYNYIARLFIDMYEAFVNGDMKKAQSIQEITVQIIDIIIVSGNAMSCGKSLMKIHGLNLGPCRKPLRTLDSKQEYFVYENVQRLLDKAECIIGD